MGKWTDKYYITHSEWANDFGGAKATRAAAMGKSDAEFKTLPFGCCSLTLRPFEGVPLCSPDGYLYDREAILEYFLKKGSYNPVSGEPLSYDQLFPAYIDQNGQGECMCPVTLKTLTDHVKVVVIKSTGRVYAYDALKHMKGRDFYTGQEYNEEDILVLQDPDDIQRRNHTNFHHHKKQTRNQLNGDCDFVNLSGTAETILSQVKRARAIRPEPPVSSVNKRPASKAATFTSLQLAMFEAIREKPSEFAHVLIQTNKGELLFRLYVGKVPITCYNFIELARTGYYKGVPFHRLISGFMIQGGDPTGTGRGGSSIWGAPFQDEIVKTLRHRGRGILSMANSGPGTNGSQFFVTFESVPHLDDKHTVFGVLDTEHPESADTLEALESAACDAKGTPSEALMIHDMLVIRNPFIELEKTKKKEMMLSAKHAVKQEKTKDVAIGKYLK